MATSAKSYDLTAREGAQLLGVCEETIKRWARIGRVPARKNFSGYWRFSRDDLDGLPVHEVVDG